MRDRKKQRQLHFRDVELRHMILAVEDNEGFSKKDDPVAYFAIGPATQEERRALGAIYYKRPEA